MLKTNQKTNLNKFKIIVQKAKQEFKIDFSLIQLVNGKVDARNLQTFLGFKKDFSSWIKNLIQKYELIEGEDFTPKRVETNGRPRIEYLLSVDTAKAICLMANNEMGKKAREYFIEAEKKLAEKSKQLTVTETLKLNIELIYRLEANTEFLEDRVVQLSTRNLNTKSTKSIKERTKKDIGGSINYFIQKIFFEKTDKNFTEAVRYAKSQKLARKAYKAKTGLTMPKAKYRTLEQYKEFLEFLRKI